jgi:signal peptidase I
MAQKLDYRLRGLHLERADHAPVASNRADHRQRQRLAKVAIFVAAVALAVWLCHAYVMQPFVVPGDAMAPTLQPGDRVLVLKANLLAGSVHSGEIVVFHPPTSLPCSVVGGRSGDLALRVVALPGDVIWSVGQKIFVDGRPLQERGWYDPRLGQIGSTPIHSTTLGAGKYYVLGDNRAEACDSRVFGPISQSSIVGEAIAIVGRHGHVSFGTV